MSKFNKKREVEMTTNNSGGAAYVSSPELELVTVLLNSFVSDGYYTKSSDGIKILNDALEKVNPEFAAKAAVYARNEFGMRSITHVLATEICKFASGKPWAKEFYSAIVRRPDDMTEILSYYYSKNKGNKSLPNALKKGFKKAFDKFDGYQLAKYRADKQEVSLVDVVNLVRPKANSRNNEALKLLISGELKSTGTFESELSAAGKVGVTAEEKSQSKSEAWSKLIMSGKIGQMALLKNLRNIIETCDEASVEKACELLTTKQRIEKSLILPFRYITALDEIVLISGKKSKHVQRALNKAIDLACANVPSFDGDTAVVIDLSGSMDAPIAGGKTKRNKVAALFGAMMAKANDADVYSFGTDCKYLPVNVNDSTMSMANWIVSTNEGSGFYGGGGKYAVGHGTNFHKIFETLSRKYARVFIFSDMENNWGNSTGYQALQKYRSRMKVDNVKVYAFNLAVNKTLQFPERNVYALSGFSEKIFDVIDSLEIDKRALINKINNYIDFAELATKE